MAAVHLWQEYIKDYGPLSGVELYTPYVKVKELMLFLTLLITKANQHLTIDKKGHINLLKNHKWLSDAELLLLNDKTSTMLALIRKIYGTLPFQFESKEFLQSIAEKERMLFTMYHSLIHAYDRSLLTGMNVHPIKCKELKKRSFELATKVWIYEGMKVQIFIEGSFVFSQGGIGLKITLKDFDRSYAEASFYNSEKCLCVIDVKSLVPRDSISNHFNFIDMITHVIFNIWERQENDHLAIFYSVSHFSSTCLGFNLDHLDPNDEWKQQINYVREIALPYFSSFVKILNLNFAIVPENLVTSNV